MPLVSLPHMCVLELTPPEVVTCAAATGFSAVNLRLAPAREGEKPYPMFDDAPMLRDTEARLRETGVRLLDVEVVWLRADTDAAAYEPLFATAARLGAENVIVAGGDADHRRASENFARLCSLAARYRVKVNLEFMAFSAIRNLAEALAIIDAAAQPNARVLLDALHTARAGVSVADVARVDRSLISFYQLCDAPREAPATIEAIAHEARFDRMLPGEGGIDLDAFVRALPAGLDVSVEVPLGGDRAKLPAIERARLIRESAARFLARMGGERAAGRGRPQEKGGIQRL
jgi:sugar phosphate isomerase/epimerase